MKVYATTATVVEGGGEWQGAATGRKVYRVLRISGPPEGRGGRGGSGGFPAWGAIVEKKRLFFIYTRARSAKERATPKNLRPEDVKF